MNQPSQPLQPDPPPRMPTSNRAAPLNHFLHGMSYPFRTFGLLLRTPRLWQYILVPLLINIALGVGLYVWLLPIGIRRVEAALAGLPAVITVFIPVITFLFALLFLLIVGIILLWFGSLLGLPWYLRLSRKLEALRGDAGPEPPFDLAVALQDIVHALGYELRKLILLIGLGVPLVLLNVVPGIGTIIATVGGLCLMALIACLDFFDPVLSRYRLRFREKLGVVRALMPASGGFALISAIMVFIPLLNLFSIPLGIASGTLLLTDYHWQRHVRR